MWRKAKEFHCGIIVCEMIQMDMNLIEDRINASDLVELCLSLIRIRSPPCEERDAAIEVARVMKGMGLQNVKVDELFNVYGMFDSGNPGKTLMLMSHMDAVPSGATAPEIANGSRFGKTGKIVTGDGAAGPKSQLAAMLIAAKSLMDANVLKKGRLLLAGCVRDTTANHEGVRYLLREDELSPDAAVVGEPTDNKILSGGRGRLEIEVRAIGRSAHAGSPETAVNPLYGIAELLEESRKLVLPAHDKLGHATLTPIDMFCAVNRPSTPHSALVIFDRRTIPSEKEEEVLGTLQGLCSALEKRSAGLRFEVSVKKSMFPYSIDESIEFLKKLRTAYRASYNRDLQFVYSRSFSTDAGFLQNEKVPCLAFGPGRIEDLATDHIEIAKLFEGSLLYAFVAGTLLNEALP
jgi:succinyl-diaminopimelate desuccinylase